MRGARRLGHRVHPAGAVVDVGQHQHARRRSSGARSTRVAVDQPQLQPRRRGDALGDVEVGRKVVALGEDDAARGRIAALQRRRGAQRLEAVDRGRVADADLARRGADQAGDLVADAAREIDPAGAVPAPDQALAPLAGGDLCQAGRGPARQRAERVAVEVDRRLRAARTRRATGRADRRGRASRTGRGSSSPVSGRQLLSCDMTVAPARAGRCRLIRTRSARPRQLAAT